MKQDHYEQSVDLHQKRVLEFLLAHFDRQSAVSHLSVIKQLLQIWSKTIDATLFRFNFGSYAVLLLQQAIEKIAIPPLKRK